MRSIDDLIGKPFAYGGRGPDAFDCYGLVRHLYREYHGIELPDYRSPTHGAQISAIFIGELRRWTPSKPITGAVALIQVPGNMHCAFLLNEFDMIHTWEGSYGVVIERVEDWKQRIKGFYRYAG